VLEKGSNENEGMKVNETSQSSLLEPIKLSGLKLRNRVAVAPMTRVSATENGVPTERMARYYAEYAHGEFGLILTEGIYPDRDRGQAYLRQPGLVTIEQVQGWRRITERVHQNEGVIFAQIMQCAPRARITSGGRTHSSRCW